MPSGKVELSTSNDSSVTDLTAYRSLNGVKLSWKARGNYEAFKITRDGKVIADAVPADARSFEDKTAPAKARVVYGIEPTTGKTTPATLKVSIGMPDPGGALVYEPFDYPTDVEKPESPLGKSGAIGTTGAYVTMDEKAKHLPTIVAGGLSHGAVPTSGNAYQGHKWSKGCAIELDDSLAKAGLLKDGAEMWIGFLFHTQKGGGGVQVSLQSADGQEGVGFLYGGTSDTFILEGGKEKKNLLVKGMLPDTTYLFVARMVWGKDGQPDKWIPYFVGDDLKLPEKLFRTFKDPINIDQSKLSRLVLQGGAGTPLDEIRVGPSFDSVVGAGK